MPRVTVATQKNKIAQLCRDLTEAKQQRDELAAALAEAVKVAAGVTTSGQEWWVTARAVLAKVQPS